MKNSPVILVVCSLVLGCQADAEVDPYETAAYESAVYGADPKADGPAEGATGALGLPKTASCPVTDLSDPGDPPAPGDETDPQDETDPTDTPGDGEPTDETDPQNETDPTDTPGDGEPTDETDPQDVPDDNDPVDETDPEGTDETDPTPETGTEPTEAPEDPCADALAESPWAPVYDLDLELVAFDDELRSPESYPRPRVDGFYMGGTEFWQQWAGGESPLFGYNGGTDRGKRCMAAAALRFQLLMQDPPEAMVRLRDESNWSGSFFNWVDDFSDPGSWGSGSGARLWAWRTGLIKFISQTDNDGSCYLPTRAMLESLAENCLSRAESGDGEIQGCRD